MLVFIPVTADPMARQTGRRTKQIGRDAWLLLERELDVQKHV